MLSTPVFDAPARLGGSGSVPTCTGMSAVARATVAQRPWVLGVLTVARLGDLQPAPEPVGVQGYGNHISGTTTSTLGNRSPGRPQS